MTATLDTPLLNLQETATLLAVSPRLVRGAAHDGRLPCIRFGRMLRFRPEDIEAFICEHRHGAGRGSVPAGPQEVAA